MSDTEMTIAGVTTMTLEEMAESLTGFEELGIESHFGQPVSNLLEAKPTIGIRALIFTVRTREGMSTHDAKNAAMALTLKQAMGFFAEAEQDFDPENPDSQSGKGGSQPD